MMAHVSRAAQDKIDFWQMVFSEFSSSSLSARDFCKAEGFSEPAFYYWRQKVKHFVQNLPIEDAPAFKEVDLQQAPSTFREAPHPTALNQDLEQKTLTVTAHGLNVSIPAALSTEQNLSIIFRALAGAC